MSASQTIPCPCCGALNASTQRFCNVCGASLRQPDAAHAATPPHTESPHIDSPRIPYTESPRVDSPEAAPVTGFPSFHAEDVAHTGTPAQPSPPQTDPPVQKRQAPAPPPPMPAQPMPVQQPAAPIPVRQTRQDKAAWNPAAIAWISVFFTFIPAGVLCALNYERLGYPEKKWKCLLGVAVAGVLYIWFLVQAPTQVARGTWLFFLLVSLTFHSRQKEMFQRHLLAGGTKAPIGVPVALSLLGMLLLLGGGGAWVAMAEARTQARVDAIAQASDALLDKAETFTQQGAALEQQTAGKDYIRDSALLKALGQKQADAYRQATAVMRQSADKMQEAEKEAEKLDAAPEVKKQVSLFAQARRKHAESLDVYQKRALVLLNASQQDPNALERKRAQLEQRAASLISEADALEKQATQATERNP